MTAWRRLKKLAGNVLTMNDYHNNDVTYTYTDTGQVSTITAPGSKTWTFAYNALGQPTSVSIPNGMTTEYGYDTQNRMTSIAHKDGSTVLDGFTYALTNGGNITRTTHQDNAKWEYEYDGRQRLTKAERYDTDGSTLMTRFSYSYDDADNMLSKVVYDARHNPASTASTAFTYDAANELTSSTTGGTPTTYAYDGWGRMTSKDYGPYTATYAYRYGSKLRSVTSTFPNEANVTYEYGGDQKRRQRTSGGTTTQYNWDLGWNVINEEDGSGDLTMTYIGHTLADVAGSDPSTGTYRYYFHDNLTSTRALRAQDKSLLGVYEYTPYGDSYAESDGNGGTGPAITHKFTGHDLDATSGLYFAPARYYAPRLARWMTTDPLGLGDGLNRYGYVGDNPLVANDPLGLRRDLCTYGHFYIRVDFTNSYGNHIRRDLHFWPARLREGNLSDFTVTPAVDPGVSILTFNTTDEEDEELFNAYLEWSQHDPGVHYNLIPNNCATVALANMNYGSKKSWWQRLLEMLLAPDPLTLPFVTGGTP